MKISDFYFHCTKISFSYRLLTASGLESTLRREVEYIYPRIKSACVASRGAVTIVDTVHPLANLNKNLVDEFLAEITLKSRVLKGVRVKLGNSFSAKWEKQVREALDRLPWKMFLSKTSTMPEIFVKSSNARLFAASRVRSMVEDSLKEFQGRTPFQQLEHLPLGSTPACSAPRVFVQVEEETFRIEIDAGGGLLNDFGFEKFESDSRLDLSEASSAAIILRSLSRVVSDFTKETIIWDPFSGSGHLMLTAARTLSGVPPGSPAIEYPFRMFPFHDRSVFAEKVSKLQIEPLANIDRITKLYATDSSLEAVEVMKRNLSIFTAGLPKANHTQNIIPFDIHIDRLPDAYIPPGSSDRVCILTSLPNKGDSERKYMKFHSLIENLRKDNRLAGCVVACSKSNMFKKLSNERWLTELRFFDGRREVEVLSLA